ncbi:MAG: hypothetical protein WDO16_25420 [Bacteroidota bacterium]
MQRLLLAVILLTHGIASRAQVNPIYENLPVGKYAVGFKIFTLTDSSRISKPEYNYSGEKNEGDRLRKITIHLWYPAVASSGKTAVTYGDYCYNNSLSSTDEVISASQKNTQINARRTGTENWFGKTTDEAWKKLAETKMLARAVAIPLKEKFPLLIGMLRPLSTSVTNELLASNGYVVAMVKGDGIGSFSQAALREIPEMHPADANFFDSLAEAYGVTGDKENMKKISAAVLDILGKKTSLTDADKAIKQTAETRLKNREVGKTERP